MRVTGTTASYLIRVEGRLGHEWSEWFDHVAARFQPAIDDSPVTEVTLHSADQPKLRGLLNKMWDLNLAVISVNRICPPEVAHDTRVYAPSR